MPISAVLHVRNLVRPSPRIGGGMGADLNLPAAPRARTTGRYRRHFRMIAILTAVGLVGGAAIGGWRATSRRPAVPANDEPKSELALPFAADAVFDPAAADPTEWDAIFAAAFRQLNSFFSTYAEQASSFRSPSTTFSFSELSARAELLQTRFDETFGMIRESGFSRNPASAARKLDHRLRNLEQEAAHAAEEERVARELLENDPTHRRYVLALQTSDSPTESAEHAIDEKLLAAMKEVDPHSWLLHRLLGAGERARALRAQKEDLQNRRERLRTFSHLSDAERAALEREIDSALSSLRSDYNMFLESARLTLADYGIQRSRESRATGRDAAGADRWSRAIGLALAGACWGLSLGVGLTIADAGLRHFSTKAVGSKPNVSLPV